MRIRQCGFAVAAVVTTVAALAGTPAASATSASSRVGPIDVVEKPITGSIDIVYTPNVGVHVIPGGDIAVAFSCSTQQAVGGATVTCGKTAGPEVDFQCSHVDLDLVGVFVAGQIPAISAGGYCTGPAGGYLAQLDSTTGATHASADFSYTSTSGVVCGTQGAGGEVPDQPYDLRCSYSMKAREPIIGGITITQATVGGAIQWTPWGVLTTGDWSCQMSNQSILTRPPTVDCDTTQANHVQWYCDNVVVDATAVPPVSGSIVPQVRAQASCDRAIDDGTAVDTTGPVPPHTPTGGTLATFDVPTLGAVVDDAYFESLNLDTKEFICQAWGPTQLRNYVPIAPWTVYCDEP